GINEFYQDTAEAGVDSVLIPDCPIEESDLFHQAAIENNIGPVYICPQNADDQLISELASKSQDYVYVVSRDGVTGADHSQHFSNVRQAERLKLAGCKHPVLGFGISKPEHVERAKTDGFSAAICGSAIVSLIKSRGDQSAFIREMMEMT
ncbi:MAG: tryptophan synthase subunit alpha, partial [Calditrichaeota bacterium]|nr:tryptophan synthase subunit alpha [Calditrichota bacterium]